MADIPISALIRQGGQFGTEDGMESGKRKSKDEYRKQKDLEEQRKAGTAPAMMDVETGRDINPHIPEFIEKTPWYIPHSGPTLKHQRPQPDRQKEFSTLSEWYPKGTTNRVAFKYRDGACENCGAMGHKKKDCFDKPRPIGAKWTNSNIQADDHQLPKLELGWDAKRDRWNGYNPEDYRFVEMEFEKMDETRKLIRANELKDKEEEEAAEEGIDGEKKAALPAAEQDEDIYAEDASAPGQSVDMDSRTRITVRNLRIREDTAKYLYNLDPNGPYYDPKSRSMRENPFKNMPGKEEAEAQYVSQNFARYTGEVTDANEAQVFAWQARCKGIDVHSLAEPTRLEALKREVEKQKEQKKSSVQNELLEKYGGAEHLNAPPKELLLAQTENYVEYNRKGKVIKGDERPAAKSRYEEDVQINNHTAVWGSYWRDGRWGYSCCHQFLRNSYCIGEQGILVEQAQLGAIQPGQTMAKVIRAGQTTQGDGAKKGESTTGGQTAAPSDEMQAAMVKQMVKRGTEEEEDGAGRETEKRKTDSSADEKSSDEEEKDGEDGDESIDEEERAKLEEQLEKEKQKKLRDDKRREVRREKRRRRKEKTANKKRDGNGEKEDRKRKRDKKKSKRRSHSSSSSSNSSSGSSSSDTGSDGSISADEDLKFVAGSSKQYSKDLQKAIEKQMKQKEKGKEMAEMGDRKRQYHRGLDGDEEQKPNELDREAYNLTKIHSADPMAQFFEEKEHKRQAKRAKRDDI